MYVQADIAKWRVFSGTKGCGVIHRAYFAENARSSSSEPCGAIVEIAEPFNRSGIPVLRAGMYPSLLTANILPAGFKIIFATARSDGSPFETLFPDGRTSSIQIPNP